MALIALFTGQFVAFLYLMRSIIFDRSLEEEVGSHIELLISKLFLFISRFGLFVLGISGFLFPIILIDIFGIYELSQNLRECVFNIYNDIN